MLALAKLLQVMVEHDASDLYLTVDSPPMYRINGVARPAGNRALQPRREEGRISRRAAQGEGSSARSRLISA